MLSNKTVGTGKGIGRNVRTEIREVSKYGEEETWHEREETGEEVRRKAAIWLVSKI
jgi:hypothetical protein